MTRWPPLTSPTFTGTPAAPTASGGTNTTQIATTAFVQTALSGVSSATPIFGSGFDGAVGKPVEPGARYRLAVNNFVASGGDGYPKITQHPSYVDTGFVDADVLRAYIAAHSPLKAADYAPGQQVVRR